MKGGEYTKRINICINKCKECPNYETIETKIGLIEKCELYGVKKYSLTGGENEKENKENVARNDTIHL